MKYWKLCIVLFSLCLGFLTVAGASGRNEPVLVAVRCPVSRATVLDKEGTVMQTLDFGTDGQAAAGPLTPGQYAIRTTLGETVFTLRANAGLCRVEGPGWTDGEVLHISEQTTGTLTVLYEGKWRWSLDGEQAGEAIPTLQPGVCRFSQLPLGWYVLTGPGENVPILLTEEHCDQTVTLPK